MREEDFDFVASLLVGRSGLVLSKEKAYLMESRLVPVARKNGLKNLEELVSGLRKKDPALTKEVTEAMTTNESFFFRDTRPFDQFKDIVLPDLLEKRVAKKNIKIWCAACSSGQEPYSLAMILKEEAAKLAGWKVDILATDLSTDILKKAKSGRYTQFEVQRGLPVQLLIKYFKKDADAWQIDESVKSMVRYKEFNLLNDCKSLGVFDVVFCRNVLIYFDQPTKTQVLSRISSVMPDDGFLYLGGAETVLGISNDFKPISGQRGIYSRNVGASAVPVANKMAVGNSAPARTLGSVKPSLAVRVPLGKNAPPLSGVRPAIGKPTIGKPTIGKPAIGRPTIGNPSIGKPPVKK